MLNQPQIEAIVRTMSILFAVHCLIGHTKMLGTCTCQQAEDYRVLEELLAGYVDEADRAYRSEKPR